MPLDQKNGIFKLSLRNPWWLTVTTPIVDCYIVLENGYLVVFMCIFTDIIGLMVDIERGLVVSDTY